MRERTNRRVISVFCTHPFRIENENIKSKNFIWINVLYTGTILDSLMDVLLEKTVKVQYLRSNKLAARTFFTVFLTHWGQHNGYSLYSKAIEQFVTFPRKSEDKNETKENKFWLKTRLRATKNIPFE